MSVRIANKLNKEEKYLPNTLHYFVVTFTNSDSLLKYSTMLAEIPGVARDSIRNEGTREINYGSCISASCPELKTP
jgi:hypothetical protein